MAIKKNLQQAGMTIVELIVVIAIISIVSGVLAFNYSGFSNSASLRNLAQEIALGIRKSQIYATSVSRAGGASAQIYGTYGVSFSVDTVNTNVFPGQKRFVLFADIPPNGSTQGNGIYDNATGNCTSGTSECLEVLTINSSDKIVKVEACNNGACIPTANGESVDIVFTRPSPDATICLKKAGVCTGPYSYAQITVQSAKGLQKIVSVWNTGQISI